MTASTAAETAETETVAATPVTEAMMNGGVTTGVSVVCQGIATGSANTAMAGRGAAGTGGLVKVMIDAIFAETGADETAITLPAAGGRAMGTTSRPPCWLHRPR